MWFPVAVIVAVVASRAAALMPDAAEASAARKVRAPFLAEGAGARAVGMGEAFTAVADDASAVSWNPGGLGQLSAWSAVAMYDSMGEDISMSYVAFALPMPVGVVAAGFTALSYGDIDVRNSLGDKIGTESPMDLAGMVSYAIGNPAWLGGWSGLAIEVVSEDAGDTLFGVSVGSVVPVNRWLRAGWAVQHVGPSNDGFSLPALAKVGCAAKVRGAVSLAVDVGYPFISREPWVAVGTEMTFLRELTLRMGYRWRADHEKLGGFSGLTVGAGVRAPEKSGLDKLSFDYAYQSVGEFMASHRVSLSYGFPETQKK